MNANFSKQIVVMILVSFAGASIASEPEPAVAVKTDGMSAHLAAKVQERAAHGFTALRHYVIRTRMIHALDLRSVIREESAPGIAQGRAEKPSQVAASGKEAR